MPYTGFGGEHASRLPAAPARLLPENRNGFFIDLCRHYDAASNEIQRHNYLNTVTQIHGRDALNGMTSVIRGWKVAIARVIWG